MGLFGQHGVPPDMGRVMRTTWIEAVFGTGCLFFIPSIGYPADQPWNAPKEMVP